MASKDQVISLHKLHPTWSSQQLADALHCESAYIRATFKRNGLKLAHRPAKPYFVELGEAAHAAGITLRDIEKMVRA